MRWIRRTHLLLIELGAAVIAAAIALLENVVTEEKHPARALLVGLISLIVISAVAQWIGRARRESRDVRTADDIHEIRSGTQELVESQRRLTYAEAERRADQLIAGFPYVLRPSIKRLWDASREEVGRVIEAIGGPETTPTLVVAEWQQSLPAWMTTAAWRSLVVAAELTNAYGADRLSGDLFLKAAPASPSPQYWAARAALVMYLHEQRQSAEEALEQFHVNGESANVFVRSVFFLVMNDRESARQLLAEWQPEELLDIFLAATIRISLVFANATSSGTSPTAQDFQQAVGVYREAVSLLPSSVALRTGLAGALIGIVNVGVSVDRHHDLEEALEHAVAARDLARDCRVSSIKPVEFACQAAFLDMQLRRAIQMGTAETGEASIEEASSDTVRTLVATAALLIGDQAIVDRAILEIQDPFRKSLLVASSAEAAGRPSADLWRAALQSARDAYERAEALLGLARMGVVESSALDTIKDELPQQAALIEAISAAASGDVAGAIRQLRSMPSIDMTAIAALATAYLRTGNIGAAADALRQGADVFNQPRLRVDAARLLSENDRHDDAVVELEQLLIDAGGNAALRHDCLGILGEWAAERRDWPTAQLRFRELLALDPHDGKGRWALILVLLQRGLSSEARRVYDDAPDELEITLPAHARAWMAIRSASDRQSASDFVNEVIDVAQKYPDDEDVQAEAIFAVLSPDSVDSDPLPAVTQTRFESLFNRFFELWPQSRRLKRFSATDVQELVSQMEELVRPSEEEKKLRAQIADQLARNTLPWATLSAITGRPYSEIVLVRAGGVLPAQVSDATESLMCRVAAKAAIDKSIVIDISTVGVLVEITNLTEQLLGQFERIMISEQQRLDAINTEFRLRGRSTSSWVYDEQADRGRLVTITAEVADERHRQAVELLAMINRFRATPIAANARTEAMGELAESTWVTTLECAAQSQVALWCDDVALRAAARSIGVPAFSTPALLDVLVEQGDLTPDQREASIRVFIERFIGDFPLDQLRLSILAAKYNGAAIPVATVFSRRAGWTNIVDAYQVWCVLVQQSVSQDRKHASEWLYYAILGLVHAQQDQRLRKTPAAMLLSAAISYIADDPKEVVRCVAAIRSGLAVLGEVPESEDPLAMAVALLRTSLARLVGITAATSYVSTAFSDIGAEDKQIVLQALYAA